MVWIDWVTHLEGLCAKDQRFISLFASKQAISSCLDARPTDTLDLDVSTPPHNLLPSALESIEPPVQPLIYLLQEITSGRVINSDLGMPDSKKEVAWQTEQRHRNAAFRASPANVSAETSAGDMSTQTAESPGKQRGHFVAILQSMTLLFKLASLLNEVTANSTDHIQWVKDSIAQAVNLTTVCLMKHMGGSCAGRAVCPVSERDPYTESEEEQRLSVALVHLVLPVMRQAVLSREVSLHETKLYQNTCPRLLKHLLPQGLPHVFQAVASELIKPGKSLA